MIRSRFVPLGLFVSFAILSAILVIAGSTRAQQGTDATEDTELAPPGETAFSLIRGSDLPVRPAGASDFDETSKIVGIEAYRDEDLGSVVYLTTDGALGVMPATPNFMIETTPYLGSFQLVRYMPRMGTSWLMEDGEYRLIEETDEDLFMGDYQIAMRTSTNENGEEEIDIIRLETLTGATWLMSDYRWLAVAEPAEESEESK